MTDWDSAIEQEEKNIPEVKLDRYSFYRGWLWGIKFHEFCRWFKVEYWTDNVRTVKKEDKSL